MHLNTAALELFGRQFFVATPDQLIERDIGRRTIARARRTGDLRVVAHGVLQLAGTAESFESHAMALLLQTGDTAALADVTAGRLWGLPRLPPGQVTVMVPIAQRPVVPEWARVIRTRWVDQRQVTRGDGLVVTSPERTLFELGAKFGPKRFEHVAEHMWNRELLTPHDAARYLEAIRGKGRSGVSRLEAWLETVQSRPARRASQSSLEVALAQALEDAGLPRPQRQFALRVNDGKVVIHLDLAWPDRRLGVEPGHALFHAGRDAMRRDAERDRWCDEVGWRIVRFDEIELRDLRACAAQVSRIYRQRPRTPSASPPSVEP